MIRLMVPPGTKWRVDEEPIIPADKLDELDAQLAGAQTRIAALEAKLRQADAEIRHALHESAKDQGTIERLRAELRAPCERCEMRRNGGGT